jgi:hypothetical protein
MTKENFQKVVKANRLLSRYNQEHKLRHSGINGTLTMFYVRRGYLYGVFSYKNSMATHPGLRLEVDDTRAVSLKFLDYVLDYFKKKGIEPPY